MVDDQRGSGRSDAERDASPADERYPDELYRVLSTPHRRRLLRYLVDESDPVTLDEAARVLAGVEAVESGTLSTEAEYEDYLVELHHRHLPVLDAADVVAYDPENRTISLEPLDTSTMESIRDLLDRDDDPDA